MPPVVMSFVEEFEPLSPLGAKGVGEPPTISSTPAIVAAIRDAIRQAGREPKLDRVPVRPIDIIG
jgi:CO/xanthine dehydrogenase Mo-binding subunit